MYFQRKTCWLVKVSRKEGIKGKELSVRFEQLIKEVGREEESRLFYVSCGLSEQDDREERRVEGVGEKSMVGPENRGVWDDTSGSREWHC